MSVSQSEQNQSKSAEDNRIDRAFWLTLVGGLLTMVSGFMLPVISPNELPPYAFQMAEASALFQLVGAFLIHKRRIGWGLIVFFISAPTIALYVISQNSGVGILVTVGILFIYLIFLPQVLADAGQIIRGQISALILAGLLIFADLYWPLPRPAVPEGLFNITAVIFIALFLIFTYLTIRQFPTFGLRGKLISTTVFVAILAVAAVAFGVNSFTRNALTVEAGEQLEAFTDSQAILIGELLFRELSTLQALSLNESLLAAMTARNESYTGSDDEILAHILDQEAQWVDSGSNNPMVTAVLQNNLSEQLRQFRATFPENSQLNLTDRYGALVASTSLTARYLQTDESWWQDAHNMGFGATYFSEPKLNELNNNSFIDVSLPLFSSLSDGSKEFAGVLHAAYSLKALEDLMVEGQFGETGQVSVHLPGVELAIDDGAKLTIYREGILSQDLLTSALLSDEDFTHVTLNGVPTFLAVGWINTLNHQPIIDNLQWAVSVRQTESETLAAVQSQQRLNMILGVVVVLLAGGAAAFVGSQLTEPILRLTAVAERVSAGDLQAQAPAGSQDEIGILANAFNSMTMQVRESITGLEDRVQARTRALETSIEVGRRISTILDLPQLVVEVVTQVRDAFNYYHAHIYLIDEADENTLRMVGGTGAAGQKMLASGHQLSLGQGLVGRAATANAPVLVPDVALATDWLPNPLLPDTKAEIAVPIALGNKVLGVLDVQHNVAQQLGQEDAELLSSIANQIAIAVENARLLAQTQAVLLETNAQARRLSLLNELSEAISRQATVDDIVAVLMQKAPEMIDASRISLHLIDKDDASLLRVAGATGLDSDMEIDQRISLEDSPMAVALAQRQLVAGVFDSEGTSLQAYFAPLYAGGTPLGTLNIAIPLEAELQEGDRQILLQIASVLATAIENRTLFNQTRARAEREKLVNDITRKIQSTVTMESALRTAVTELGQAFQSHTAVNVSNTLDKDSYIKIRNDKSGDFSGIPEKETKR